MPGATAVASCEMFPPHRSPRDRNHLCKGLPRASRLRVLEAFAKHGRLPPFRADLLLGKCVLNKKWQVGEVRTSFSSSGAVNPLVVLYVLVSPKIQLEVGKHGQRSHAMHWGSKAAAAG